MKPEVGVYDIALAVQDYCTYRGQYIRQKGWCNNVWQEEDNLSICTITL
jgi:hypothetical protein